MQKPEGLKRVLLKFVPGLANDPARLQLFVDDGHVAARTGASLGFEWRYTLTIVVLAYAGDVDALAVPILAWIAEQQPELLDKPDGQPFGFTAEILDGAVCDIEIKLELTERVAVADKPGGGWTATHLAEPSEIDAFDGVCGARLWFGFLGPELVARTADPDHQVPPG